MTEKCNWFIMYGARFVCNNKEKNLKKHAGDRYGLLANIYMFVYDTLGKYINVKCISHVRHIVRNYPCSRMKCLSSTFSVPGYFMYFTKSVRKSGRLQNHQQF